MDKKKQRIPVIWVENWLEEQLIQRGWNTRRLKNPLYQGDLLAEKNNACAKIGVKSRKIFYEDGEELQVFLGFHFQKKGTEDFLILQFNNSPWVITDDALIRFNQKFGEII
jgi:hypothetical protein